LPLRDSLDGSLQSKNIVLPNLLPGKLFLAAIYPTISTGKESKVPAKLELKSTCGCPVDEVTLRTTEMTGMPIEVVLTQVCQCLDIIWSMHFTSVFVAVSRQDLLELEGYLTL
jgi:hypothetical protein